MNKLQTHPMGREQSDNRSRYLSAFLIIIPLIEIFLFAVACHYLGLGEGGWFGIAKLTLLCIGAFCVSYAIYRMAVEKGALLYVKGSLLALVFSVMSIGVVSGSYFITTSAGWMISKVEESNLGQFVQQVGTYSDTRVAAADRAAELAPVMDAMTQDLSARTDSEGATGPGPIFRALNGLLQRTGGLSQRINESLALRQNVLAQIAETRRIMDETLADEGRNIWTRRAELRNHYSRLQRLWIELDAAVPANLVRSFAAELESGVLIPNRADANARIHHTLDGYAATLAEALGAQNKAAGEPPAFPEKTGVLETFKHAGRYLPVVMTAFIVDVLFIFALLFYAVLTLKFADIDDNPDRWAKKKRRVSPFDIIADMLPRSIPVPHHEREPTRPDQEGGPPATPPKSPKHTNKQSRR